MAAVELKNRGNEGQYGEVTFFDKIFFLPASGITRATMKEISRLAKLEKGIGEGKITDPEKIRQFKLDAARMKSFLGK